MSLADIFESICFLRGSYEVGVNGVDVVPVVKGQVGSGPFEGYFPEEVCEGFGGAEFCSSYCN